MEDDNEGWIYLTPEELAIVQVERNAEIRRMLDWLTSESQELGLYSEPKSNSD